ncbi:protein C-mannosyl-transferase DPY19L3-like [Ptychodera flava]|uniref:protein C-mannosyl-transferase DPY19L3-like n=1 Tax=Ptychodera flava TaxID=63121 RepID=UPI00396A3F98
MSSELRQRKQKTVKSSRLDTDINPVTDERIDSHEDSTDQSEDGVSHDEMDDNANIVWQFSSQLSIVIGIAVAIFIAYGYAVYIWTLHENRLWFSNIQEVEREISFRTESGLYYSYYKQMINAKSLKQGLYELTHDNITENWRTINVLERMNIYQEVILSVLYKTLNIQKWLQPVFFYIYSVFTIHGLYLIALYMTTWMLSESWLAGVLAAAFYVFNKDDSTRVEFTIPLRESFSLPFLFLQILFITYYLKPGLSATKQRLSCCCIAVCTFLFALSWQFAQFVLLLQALTLFSLALLELIPMSQMRWILSIQFVCLLLVCVAQFFHPMIPGSLVISFIPAAFLVTYLKGQEPSAHGLIRGTFRLIGHVTSVVALTVVINVIVKSILLVEADEHIFKFLSAKFGASNTRDFDANLYLCVGAFGLLPMDTFYRLTDHLLFPFYGIAQLSLLVLIIIAVWKMLRSSEPGISCCNNDTNSADNHQHWHPLKDRPELAFHCIQTVFFACLAISTMRFKYLWTPEMCILAAFVVSDYQTWKWLLKKCDIKSEITVWIVRHASTLTLLVALLIRVLPNVKAELEELREFYDPDTVDLMNWIKDFTKEDAVFSGSMQLLAGVKLCTGRKLTNHPHYEDKLLREKTFQVYQYYGRRSPEEVYDIHKSIGTDYIILEDSICYSGGPPGCRLPDLIDIANGHVVEGIKDREGLVVPLYGRFCDKIRQRKNAEYTKFFKLVFKNDTFHVYKVL